jgi:hypothetical protein
MKINDFIGNYRNHPVLLIGAGISLRYLNTHTRKTDTTTLCTIKNQIEQHDIKHHIFNFHEKSSTDFRKLICAYDSQYSSTERIEH